MTPRTAVDPTQRALSRRSPPRWVNAVVALLLHTPGVQRLLGRGIALLTVTGRRSGRRYTMPVRHKRAGPTVTVLTKRSRNWWRNLRDLPEVELRLAGRELRGRAELLVGDAPARRALAEFLADSPMDARGYGVRLDPDGTAGEHDLSRLLPQVVVIRITLTPP